MELPCPHESDLFYRPAFLEAWKRGAQVEQWADEYPVIFDADNRRNARNHCGRGYHFGEWFTAITLYRSSAATRGFPVAARQEPNPSNEGWPEDIAQPTPPGDSICVLMGGIPWRPSISTKSP